MYSNKTQHTETISSSYFEPSPELLDSISDLLLQLCEDIDDASFTDSVVSLLQAFDGETTFKPESEILIQETLKHFRNRLGLNSYCLLRGILYLHSNDREKMDEWFNLIALNSLEGSDYMLYRIMTGEHVN